MSSSPAQAAEPRADDLLAGLTEPQRQAVLHVQGPLLVLAGAGSGKTRVITRRIAHLVLGVGIAPWNVLAITFTNKAAGEMRERVAALVSERQARAITVATFHSLCARILRRYAEQAGLPPGFSVYDSADQQRAVKQALEELEINTTNFPPAKVLYTISAAKGDLIDAEAYAQVATDFYTKNVARIYRKYQEILRKNGALDFDDLLLCAMQLLKKQPDVLADLRQRFQYILIDEYQDTNHVQFLIAHALASGHQNICATGDPDQSIYSWRGADIGNIMDFEEHYPNATVVRLEQNFRSTPQILALADKLIQNNKQRRHKGLWTENQAGTAPRIVRLADERAEAQWIVEDFRRLHDAEKLAWGQMAVFYRINSLSRVIEEEFLRAHIPYQIARGTSFYERKEVKDLLAYLRAAANPADEVSLARIINTPARGISDATVKLFQAQAATSGQPLLEVLRSSEALAGLNTRAAGAVKKFTAMLENWGRDLGTYPSPSEAEPVEAERPVEESPTGRREGALSPPQADRRAGEGASVVQLSLKSFVERVLRDSGLESFYKSDKTDPDLERISNLGELVSSAQQFDMEFAEIEADPSRLSGETPSDISPQGPVSAPSLLRKLIGFLERVSLVSDVDSVDSNQGAVTLMTLHAAKGLEFPAVAILGVEDGLLPHQRANDNAAQLEEERRLCFVGITRARRFLTLTHARQRTVFGQTLPTIPSRFLRELPREHITDEDHSLEGGQGFGGGSSFGSSRTHGQTSVGFDAEDQTTVEFPPGSRVRHPIFGLGRVLAVNPGRSASDAKVQVAFNSGAIKTLILEYAKLERVGV